MDFWIIYAKGEPGRCLPVTFSSEKRDDAELGYQSHLARNFADFSYHKII